VSWKCKKFVTICAVPHSLPCQAGRLDSYETVNANCRPLIETLAKAVRDAIEKNEPELGLDRLRTFVITFNCYWARDEAVCGPVGLIRNGIKLHVTVSNCMVIKALDDGNRERQNR